MVRKSSKSEAADQADSRSRVAEVVDLADDAVADEARNSIHHPQQSARLKVTAEAVTPGCSAGGRDGGGQGGEDSDKTVFLDEAAGVLMPCASADPKAAASAGDDDANADQSVSRLYKSDVGDDSD